MKNANEFFDEFLINQNRSLIFGGCIEFIRFDRWTLQCTSFATMIVITFFSQQGLFIYLSIYFFWLYEVVNRAQELSEINRAQELKESQYMATTISRVSAFKRLPYEFRISSCLQIKWSLWLPPERKPRIQYHLVSYNTTLIKTFRQFSIILSFGLPKRIQQRRDGLLSKHSDFILR